VGGWVGGWVGWNEGWKQGIFRKIEKKMDFFLGLLLLVFLPFTNLSKVFFFWGFYLGGRVGVSSCCNLLVIFPFANLSKVWSFGFGGAVGGELLFGFVVFTPKFCSIKTWRISPKEFLKN